MINRPVVRLTPRGIGLLAASAVCFAAGEALGHEVPRILAGAALAAVVAGVLLCVRPLSVDVERTVWPDRVERGKPAVATLVATNPTGRATAAFSALDPPAQHPVGIDRLRPQARGNATYALPSERRGRIAVGPLTLHRRDLLGLVTGRVTTGSVSTLWVYPRTHDVLVVAGAHLRHHHDGVYGDPPVRGSIDLRAVREYMPGDEPRHIHWWATARTGTVMVRDYVDPARPRFTVLLDTRDATLRPAEFENAVEIAASLVKAACAQGCRTRLGTTGGLDLDVEPGLVGQHALLDALCEVAQHAAGPAEPVRLPAGRDPGARSAFITGGVGATDPATLAAVVRHARRVTVFDVSASPPVGPVASSVVTIRETDPATALTVWAGGLAAMGRVS
ncbi:DUF58 domain-containing protein [Actinokineospora sp. NBRC 105648]|uniref:DUF58 domain-containing protein n=1 Tax=Actinokineospora sp. NBRC 105648 TaxID=3032206 RepID=UPI0024A32BEA|nr:DUF58 domain-containing protein [Actinokineospora sp. NBRC 105648]GLZ40598.1 hypothetical protein Acsp05_42220 [Actinokineospora sp. NBRC 105648]